MYIQSHISYSGVDYTVTSLSFQFGPTTERVAVPVDIIDDMLVEGEEDIILSLTSATVGGQNSSGAQLGTRRNTRITTEDNDGERKHYRYLMPLLLHIVKYRTNSQVASDRKNRSLH